MSKFPAIRLCVNRSALSIALMLMISGCGGGQSSQSTSVTPTPNLPSGTEILYFHGAGQVGVRMSTLAPSTGGMSQLDIASPEQTYNFETLHGAPNWPAYSPTLFSPLGAKYVYSFGVGTYGSTLKQIGFWAYHIVPTNGLIFAIAGYVPFLPKAPFYNPTGATMDGLGRYLYVSDYSLLGAFSVTGLLKEFTIVQESGALSEGPIVATQPTGYFNIQAADSKGKFLFGWSQSLSGDLYISVFSIDPSTGTPKEVTGSPFLVASRNGDTSPAAPQFFPMGMALNPAGTVLYASVGVYTISLSNGQQQELTSIYSFAVNSSTGALSQNSVSTVLLGSMTFASWLAVHPNGKFLYATAETSTGTGPIRNLVLFPINSSNGALTATPASVFSDSNCCKHLLIDPTGAMLLDEGDMNWSSFKIDASTGNLTPTDTTPSILLPGYGFLPGFGPGIIIQYP